MGSIKLVGVVGAGQMGRGIAQVAAQVGLDVILLDQNQELSQQSIGMIGQTLKKLVEKGKLEAGAMQSILGRMRSETEFSALKSADVVIEAVTEDLELKKSIFQQLDKVTQSSCLLASNTSSISVTTLAASTQRPERVVGMHFFNPVPLMGLVEIVRALQTSDATYQTIASLAEQMQKKVVTSKDSPGFMVNRMLMPFLMEACFELQEGVGSVEDIDNSAKLGLNHPMGPFELADFIGLDTCLYVAQVLQRELGDDKYRPPTILKNYVAAGWLGRKTGRGFYNYKKD